MPTPFPSERLMEDKNPLCGNPRPATLRAELSAGRASTGLKASSSSSSGLALTGIKFKSVKEQRLLTLLRARTRLNIPSIRALALQVVLESLNACLRSAWPEPG